MKLVSKKRSPGGVFWRTFFLIAILIGVSLLSWYQGFRVLERSPRAQQTAQLIVSIVNLTRSALIHSDPEKRRALLIDLARNEDIRIYPLEPTDTIQPLPDQDFLRIIDEYARAKLGSNTTMTMSVNGQPGLWVSFFIDEDGYWVAFDADRLESVPRIQWFRWGVIALLLSLVGAVVISRLINLPLKRLATAALAVGDGQRPPRLPEAGPREIREANASFNDMVEQLERIEADRVLLLAGISHDLRTPLTRLRLEVELNDLDETTRTAISSDIEQMDSIIGQFLDYARPAGDLSGMQDVDLGVLAQEVAAETAQHGNGLTITADIKAARTVRGDLMELRRIILNLVENARRYGQSLEDGISHLEIEVGGAATPYLQVVDHGVGIAAADAERLKRPFTRLDTARSQASGAGLGLAIVERICVRHGAQFDLLPTHGGGLTARVTFNAARRRVEPTRT